MTLLIKNYLNSKRRRNKLDFDIYELQQKLNNMKNQGYDWAWFAREVIKWNYVAGGGKHDFSNEKKDLQHSFVLEEFKEVCEAIEKQDKDEVISEFCDLVVVASYSDFLECLNENINKYIDDAFTFSVRKFNKYEFALYNIQEAVRFKDYVQVCHLAAEAIENIGNFEHIANGILEANWSKLPTVDEFKTKCVLTNWKFDEYDKNPRAIPLNLCVDYQIKKLEELFEGRYNGFYHQVVEVDGVERIVFKDSNGKIMKPITFKKFSLGSA
jgi:hypothetical protein